ncbi:MAG: adenosine kinase [Armatimonadota bacterium]|nr:adenosine kinase [bacterium]MCS7309275.1 adenosine kinase [Armatimonadota bacterium]MDW8105256.1 adenosine kinase [Armatimonadota bacterium]MDW8289086.1 adenosine kinase [Armatimonadota bacterium]
MGFDVFGMCNALVDIQARVEDSFIAELGLQKGGMFLIDEAQKSLLAERLADHMIHSEAGGSGANTMIGVALLGGKACYTSKVGDDENGELYRRSLHKKGVKPNLALGEGSTGISCILLTPDAQRTMCTHLGASQQLRPEEVNVDDLRQSRYLYITGYLWDTESQKMAVLHAMQEANRAGVRVAFSLSDLFCVRRHKTDFQRLLEQHVDVLIGNAAEAQELTDTNDPHRAAQVLADYCDIAVVTMDSRGALIRHRKTVYEVPAFRVRAVDATGAGDMFAAGLLYGLCTGLPLEVSGRLAAYTAAQVVTKIGARLDSIEIPADVLHQF